MRFADRIKPPDEPYHDQCVAFLASHAQWVAMRARPDFGEILTCYAKTEVPVGTPIVGFLDLLIGVITKRESEYCRTRFQKDVARALAYGWPLADLLPYPPDIEVLSVEVKTRPESTSTIRRQLQIYRSLVDPRVHHVLAVERRVSIDLDAIRGDGFRVVRFHNPSGR